MKRRGALVLLAAVLPLLVVACAGGPPPVTKADAIWRDYGTALAIATDTYSECLRSAGAAHARGLLTDAQLEQVRFAAGPVKTALDVARSALLLYANSTDPQPQELRLAVQVAQQALLGLIDQLAKMGVSP